MERLRYLLCLSVADIAAVGPTIWNEWKGTLLSEIFRATERFLMGEEDASSSTRERVGIRIESTLGKAEPGEKADISAMLQQLPWRAVMGLPPRQLLKTARLMQATNLMPTAQGGVDVFVDSARGESLVMIFSVDRKRLLAQLTSALSSSYVNIVAAQAFSLKDKRVLDVFHIQDASGKALSEQSDLQRIKDRVTRVLAGDAAPQIRPTKPDLLMRQVSVAVRPLLLASSRQTTIEVAAADRVGLLAALTGEIDDAGFGVRGASISTFGECVVDVFFLTRDDGEMLSEQEVAMICTRLANVAKLSEDT